MLFKKLLRTALKYKAQFISMIIMVGLGMGIFFGFNAEWYSLKCDIYKFLDDTNYADYRIYNEKGFSEDDINAVSFIDGVDEATRFFSVNVGIDGKKSSVALTAVEDYTVSTMYITNGEDYSESVTDGIWLSDKFAEKNDIKLGDEITLTYSSAKITCKVRGLAKSGEYMICLGDSSQLMPDYRSFGFAYVSPQTVKNALGGYIFYSQINIISDLDKDTITEKVNTALGKTTLLLSKEDHASYAAGQSEIEEGQTMGNILPVLFLAIAVLTMVTTMHRITANEKTQIGTLKALGFKNRTVAAHYTSYGLFIGIVGTLLGILLGYGIAYMIVNPNMMQGAYFDMAYWNIYMPWYCWLVGVAALCFLTFISFLSVRKMLKGTAADALRPYVPRKVKPLAVEKTKLWNKLSFGTRWNLRDMFRHKSRSIMTLIGVIGCTVLIVGGMGMSDTMDGYLGVIDEKLYLYETRINFTESVTDEKAEEIAALYKADTLATASGEAKDETVSLEIYDIKNGKIGFINSSNKSIMLGDEGVYICGRYEDSYAVGETFTFSPYGSDEGYTLKVAGTFRSCVSECIAMTREYAETVGLPCTYSAAFTDTLSTEIASDDAISGVQTKSYVMGSYDSFMEIMDTMVILLVVAAVVLGVVVLYNLGVMSYVERYRELATLKVVGFRNRRIGQLLISQNLWLTFIGLIIGLPLGYGVLNLLIVALASEYEMSVIMGAATYIVSVVLTLGVSLLVGLFVARKNRKINMVEALKGAE